MKIFKIANSIQYLPVEYDDYNLEDIDVFNGIENVEKHSGINILRDQEPTIVAVLNGNIVGVLWESFSGDEYSFDVAVLPEFRRMGIAKKLIDIALSNYSDYEDMGAKIKLDVVNPNLESYLKTLGFIVEEKIGGHSIMTRN